MIKKLDLGKEEISRLFLYYCIPGILSMIVMSIYVIIDGIFVGRCVGASGLAAINIAEPFYYGAMAISIMIAAGGSTIITIELGKENVPKAREKFTLSFIILVIIAVIITAFTFTFSTEIAKFLGASNELIKPVASYLKVICIFLIAFVGGGFLDAGIRAMGNPKYSMIGNIIATSANIVLDYIFVVKFKWGIKGAAVASGIAFTISFVMFLVQYLKEDSKLKFVKFNFDMKDVKNIFYNGSSEALTEVSVGLTTFLFNIILIDKMGEIGVSAFSIILYISSIISAVIIGVGQSIGPIISYNYGAKQQKRILKTLRLSLILVLCVGIISTGSLILFGKNLIQLFSDDIRLIDLTFKATKIYSLVFLLSGFNIITSSYFTSISNAKISAIISILRGVIFIAINMIILPNIFGEVGIWITMPVTEFMTFIVSVYLLTKTKNKNKNLALI